MSDYVVDIKSSARRRNGAVGEVVQRAGTHHRFDTRADADAWAERLAMRGGANVWVRRANPNDRSNVDGYLISRERSPYQLFQQDETIQVEQSTL